MILSFTQCFLTNRGLAEGGRVGDRSILECGFSQRPLSLSLSGKVDYGSRFSILCVLFLKHGPLTIIMLVLLLLFFLLFHLFCLFVLCFFSCDLIRQPEVLSINSYKAIQVEFAANGNLWVWIL